MATKVKLADGKYCYAGPTCRLHSPTGASAATAKYNDAMDALMAAKSYEEVAAAKIALTEAQVAYDAIPENKNRLLEKITEGDDPIAQAEALVRYKAATYYEESVEEQFRKEAEEAEAVKAMKAGELQGIQFPEETEETRRYLGSISPTINQGAGYMGSNEFIGAKSGGERMSMQELRTALRKEIADAVKAGYLPKNLDYHVTKGSSYNSIDVDVRGLKESAIYAEHGNGYGVQYTAEAKELRDRLRHVTNVYNYDNSNGMVDYFNRRYYNSVNLEDERSRNWRVRQANERKERAAQLKAEKEVVASYKNNPASLTYDWVVSDGPYVIRKVTGKDVLHIEETSRLNPDNQLGYVLAVKSESATAEKVQESFISAWKRSPKLRKKATRVK